MSENSFSSNRLKFKKKFKSEVVKDEASYLFNMPTLGSDKKLAVDTNRFVPKCTSLGMSPLKISCSKKPGKLNAFTVLKKIASTNGVSTNSSKSIMSYIIAPEVESRHPKENRINEFLATSKIFKINLREALDELK
ncbi:unnamed protein product [Moneuplotes crassus]|uniref:Uncharacterized protein n=1 Tax=Euplotes crassus TaxID=5936 RepID=A0AAD1XB15_EUPCR|nr:unnamed protein product [Moneuplotes crassus]